MIRDAETPQEIFKIVKAHGMQFDDLHISSAFTALSRKAPRGANSFKAERGFVLLLRCVAVLLPFFKARELVNILYSMAKIDYQPEESFLRKVEDQVRRNSPRFSSFDVSMLFWSFSRLDHCPSAECLQAVLSRHQGRLHNFGRRDTALCLYAMARLGHNPGEGLLEEFSRASLEKLDKFTAQDMMNIMWAFAKLDYCPNRNLIERVLARVGHDLQSEAQLGRTHYQAHMTTVWAVSQVGYTPSRDFLAAFTSALPRRMSGFSSRHFVQCVVALAAFKYRPGESFFQSFQVALLKRLPEAKEVAEFPLMLSAFERLKFKPSDEFLDVFVDTWHKLPESHESGPE